MPTFLSLTSGYRVVIRVMVEEKAIVLTEFFRKTRFGHAGMLFVTVSLAAGAFVRR